ncbi:MAG TPA: hypothetical protein PLD20_00795 [Blastocatellia bacterium]|nr:hypothetical protein [Blastocatellia bacterium]HMV81784.1 hypothetical protein [Blastocatellia bacterium]HMX24736.1 hypothetical protein [Blastocatellia bacterium]HMY70683.1 hypothetical protein [Blastocatellia bacterium]HMZ16472.1 hypothetical protein [Blastocatellia bacterium]
MARKNRDSRAESPSPHPVIQVTVHAEFGGQETAFKLGFYHGYEAVKPRTPESFIYQPTAAAYAAGLMAGCAARATRRQ